MRKLLSIIFIAFISLSIAAQPGQRNQNPIEVKGKVVDSKTGKGLMGAVIKATSSDGGHGTFAVADSLGDFTLKFEQRGRYEIEYSCVGYKSKTTSEEWIWRSGESLKTAKLKEDATYLQEVTVTGMANRATVKGDTLVYSADAFKVLDGSSAADLVKKMPGITVDKEGVKAQGEKVQKLTVDGKEFFEYDPQLALNTLPAEVVKDVQVYDRKSDKTEQTGFDDGSRTKAMNLNTKAYKRNGIFGKIYGGGGWAFGSNSPMLGSLGDGGLYKGGFNLNLFSGNRRISILGLTNNVDQTFFDFGDLSDAKANDSYGVAVHENGVARANAFGLNFNDEYLGGKLKVSSSYFTNITRHESADSIESNSTDMAMASITKSKGLIHNNKHIFNSRITYDIDKNNTLLFIPKITYHKRDTETEGNSKTWLHNMEELVSNPSLWDDIHTVNKSHSTGDSEEFSASGSLRFTHRFEAKTGRSLSAEVSGSITNKTAHSDSYQFVNDLQTKSANKNHSSVSNFAANVSFTEPLAEKHLLEIGVNTNYYQNHDYNDYYGGKITSLTASYYEGLALDSLNSYGGNSHNFYYSAYASYNWRFGDFTFIPSLSYNSKRDYSSRIFEAWAPSFGEDPSESITRTFSWIKPSIQLNWRKNTSFVSASYSMDTSTPYLGDLYTKLFTSNPYSFFVGNPDLKESQAHNLRVHFSVSNPEKGTSLFAQVSGTHTTNGQGTSYISNLSKEPVLLSELPGYGNDSRFANVSLPISGNVSTRINTGSSNRANAFLMYSGPIKAISCNYQIGLFSSYNSTPQESTYYLGKSEAGVAQYKQLNGLYQSLSVGPNIALTSSISDKIDFGFGYQMQWSKSWSDIESSRNVNQTTHEVEAMLKWEFFSGFVFQLAEEWSNYEDPRNNTRTNQSLTNISLAKKFGKKNQYELKLETHDLFNQNKGYRSYAGNGSVVSNWSKQMPRYAMLTFTYQLKSSK